MATEAKATTAKKVVKETATKVEAKVETKATPAKAEVKAETKTADKAPAKKAPAKKAATKTTATKTAAKKAPAKKAAAKKAPAKKAAAKKATNAVIAEFNGFDVDITNIIDEAKAAFVAQGNKAADAKKIEVYVNSTGVWAVVNGNEIGKIK